MRYTWLTPGLSILVMGRQQVYTTPKKKCNASRHLENTLQFETFLFLQMRFDDNIYFVFAWEYENVYYPEITRISGNVAQHITYLVYMSRRCYPKNAHGCRVQHWVSQQNLGQLFSQKNYIFKLYESG